MKRNEKDSFCYPHDDIIKQLACENFTKIPQQLQNVTYSFQADFLFIVIPIKTSAALFLQTSSFLFFKIFIIFFSLHFYSLLCSTH